MDKLCNIIRTVCDEITWMIPAHISSRIEYELERRIIDIYADTDENEFYIFR